MVQKRKAQVTKILKDVEATAKRLRAQIRKQAGVAERTIRSGATQLEKHVKRASGQIEKHLADAKKIAAAALAKKK